MTETGMIVSYKLRVRAKTGKAWLPQAARLVSRVRAYCAKEGLRIVGPLPLDLPGCDAVAIEGVRVVRQYDILKDRLSMRADAFVDRQE